MHDETTKTATSPDGAAMPLPAAALEPLDVPDDDRVIGGATVAGGVLNGKAISKPQPVYPPIA